MLFSLRSILPKEIRYRGDILIIEKKHKSFTLFVMFFLLLSGLTGLEPATSAVTGRRSNQLNYSPHTIVCLKLYKIATVLNRVASLGFIKGCPLGRDRYAVLVHTNITILYFLIALARYSLPLCL